MRSTAKYLPASASRVILLLATGLVLGDATPARAHWCSNIYQTFARIVVKPERQNINLGVGESGDLRVRVRNNFPYTLYWLKLRANPPAELDVTVTPSEAEAEQKRVYPGHEVTFVLHITRTAAGSDDVAALNLQVAMELTSIMDGQWLDLDHNWLRQDVTESEVRNRIQNPSQTLSLNNALLADLGCNGCEADGVDGLRQAWGATPTDFENQIGEQCIRAGHQLSVRLAWRAFNEVNRGDVVGDMIDNMDHDSDWVRGLAAFFAAYGGSDAGVASRIDQMASSDASQAARRMAQAAQLILGESTESQVRACLNDGNEDRRVRQVCAAALGIMGDDQPITDFLIPDGFDGLNHSDNYPRLLGAYLLQLVVFYRRGGPEGVGTVSFLDEDVVVDEVAPAAPGNLVVNPI